MLWCYTIVSEKEEGLVPLKCLIQLQLFCHALLSENLFYIWLLDSVPNVCVYAYIYI